MRHARSTLPLVGLLAGALALSACGGDSASGSGGDGARIGFSSPVLAQDGQKAIVDGFEAAGAGFGWETKVYDANLSIDTQVSNIQTMVDGGDAAITAWALDDDAIAGAYAQAASADIPVIGINSAGDGVDGTVWWEQQTCEPGGIIEQLAARYAEAKPGGDIAIVSGPEAPSIVALTACFKDAAEAAGLNVVSEQKNTGDNSAGANTLVQDILSQHPDLAGVWSYNDNSALGASSAILAAGGTVWTPDNPDGVVVTGANADQAAIEAVADGTMSATLDPDPRCTGYVLAAAVEEAMDSGTLAEDYVVAGSILDASTVGEYVAPADKTCSLDELPLVGGAR